MAVSAGLRVGSKFIILIFGIHPSGVSRPPALAVRFLLRAGGEEEEGDEDDIRAAVLRMQFHGLATRWDRWSALVFNSAKKRNQGDLVFV